RKCAIPSPCGHHLTSPQPSPEGEGFSIAKAMVTLWNMMIRSHHLFRDGRKSLSFRRLVQERDLG
ncbi:MAG: hypothetical protein WD824_22395, partial [Cyclobacteriaceae bacterium]